MGLLLTIDLGNTNTVLGVFEGAELRAHWRLATRREQTADEYGILVRNLFASSGLAPAGIEGVALASVVPPLTPVLVALSKQYLSLEPLVVEPGVRT
ncbi:MAG TPA: type III pantothenate kinase, partial [Vicinamibacteria bacterium]